LQELPALEHPTSRPTCSPSVLRLPTDSAESKTTWPHWIAAFRKRVLSFLQQAARVFLPAPARQQSTRFCSLRPPRQTAQASARALPLRNSVPRRAGSFPRQALHVQRAYPNPTLASAQ